MHWDVRKAARAPATRLSGQCFIWTPVFQSNSSKAFKALQYLGGLRVICSHRRTRQACAFLSWLSEPGQSVKALHRSTWPCLRYVAAASALSLPAWRLAPQAIARLQGSACCHPRGCCLLWDAGQSAPDRDSGGAAARCLVAGRPVNSAWRAEVLLRAVPPGFQLQTAVPGPDFPSLAIQLHRQPVRHRGKAEGSLCQASDRWARPQSASSHC